MARLGPASRGVARMGTARHGPEPANNTTGSGNIFTTMKKVWFVAALLLTACQRREPTIVFCVTDAKTATFDVTQSRPIFGPGDRPCFVARGPAISGQQAFLELTSVGGSWRDVTEPKTVDQTGLIVAPMYEFPTGQYRAVLFANGQPRAVVEFGVVR